MQVDFVTDRILPCQCGFKPDHYIVGYGMTPYDIHCVPCGKQLALAKCLVTGSPDNAIDYWNKHVAHLTNEEQHEEVANFKAEQKLNTGYDGYSEYQYYWIEGPGEIIHKRCK